LDNSSVTSLETFPYSRFFSQDDYLDECLMPALTYT